MAGLQSYVRGNQPPQLAQPARADRLMYATNAKVSARKPTTSTPQPVQSTVYSSWNIPSPAVPHTMYRPSWHSASQQPAITTQKGIFDDTLSGLDETESVVLDERQDVASNGPNINQFTQPFDDYDEVETVVEDVNLLRERPSTPRGGGLAAASTSLPKAKGNMERWNFVPTRMALLRSTILMALRSAVDFQSPLVERECRKRAVLKARLGLAVLMAVVVGRSPRATLKTTTTTLEGCRMARPPITTTSN